MKNLMKVAAAIAVVFVVALGSNLKAEKSAETDKDLVSVMNSANAWGACTDWIPGSYNQPHWTIVTHVFNAEQRRQKIQEKFGATSSRGINWAQSDFCLYAVVGAVCGGIDYGVTQQEAVNRQLGEYSSRPPVN